MNIDLNYVKELNVYAPLKKKSQNYNEIQVQKLTESFEF